MRNTMIVLSVVDVALLVAALVSCSVVLGRQSSRIAANLDECADLVRRIRRDAEPIAPDLVRLTRVAEVVAGALPLLSGATEDSTVAPVPSPGTSTHRPPTRPVPGGRRSRMTEAVGYLPPREPPPAGRGRGIDGRS